MAHDRLNAILTHVRRAAGPADGPQTDAQLLGRYLDRQDEAAFAALVRRHGGLVAAACRWVLADEADVEDAFQATFLVLLRKADTIRSRQTLGCWLYRVAGRVAAAARAARDRRRAVEQWPGVPPAPAAPDPSWREVCAVLRAELDRLPLSLRLPLVLCYLDGKTRDEAARQLGWTASTLRGRLDRGRAKLRARLSRRGIDLSAGLLAAVAGDGRASATVLSELARVTTGLATGGAPAAVAALARAATRVAVAVPLAVAGGVILVGGLLAAAMTVGRTPSPEMPPAQPQAAQADPAELPAPTGSAVAYGGRVVRPDGRPVAGAKVYVTSWWGYHYEPFSDRESATSDADGRFAFTAPTDRIGNSAIVSAAAPGLGLGFAGVRKDEPRTDLTLRLVADDVPITGTVVDLEGKPVAGATVRLLQVMASPKEDLGPWLKAAQDKSSPPRNRDLRTEQDHLSRYTTAPCLAATADAAGRFRLTGVGRERLTILQLDGPTIASEHLRVLTRPGRPFDVPDLEADPEYGQPRIDTRYYGADFRHAAAPTKPVVGAVRDKDTHEPLAGVTVRSEKLANNPLHGRHHIQTKTDARGRYRLVGLPKGAGNKISLVPTADQPYVTPTIDVPDSFGLDPVTVGVELKRAVWIEGRLTDRATGKAIRGVVSYITRRGNPHSKDYHGFWGGIQFGKRTNDDGTFRLIGLPGPGQVLVFREPGYLLGFERDDADGLHEEFGHVPSGNFGAFARVDPPKGAESVWRDVTLVPGWTFTGTVLGPDGQPLAGARPTGLSGKPDEVMKGAAFTVRDYNPRRPRPVFFRLPEKGLVGIVRPPAKNGDAVTVRLEPGATVTGRLVDAAGEPRAGVALRLSYRPKAEPNWDEESLDETVTTERDGRFRITALVPDMTYYLNADQSDCRVGGGLRLGETTDLGDVRIRQ